MTQRIRVGIAGAGRIVRDEHVPRLRAIPGVELVAVANQTLASSTRAAAALGIARALPDWGALVADPEIDAILVGTWPYLHAPIAIAALEHGHHVLTEARMAASAGDAAAMLDASLAAPGQVAMVVPASFSLWADRAILRILAGDAIGRLLAVRVQWNGDDGGDAAEHWRWQRRFSGSNIMALGILYEAMARWLGHAQWLTAEARVLRPRKPGADGRLVPTDVPDHLLVTAGFPGDVVASIEMSAVTLTGVATTATFVGEAGTLVADFGAGRLTLRRGAATDPIDVAIETGEADEWRAERDFVAAIRGERPVDLTDFATGLRYMRFVDAVHDAAWTGERVVLGGA